MVRQTGAGADKTREPPVTNGDLRVAVGRPEGAASGGAAGGSGRGSAKRSGTSLMKKGDCPRPGSRGRFIIHCCVNVMSELGAVIGQRETRERRESLGRERRGRRVGEAAGGVRETGEGV